jgi:hypothetical protein
MNFAGTGQINQTPWFGNADVRSHLQLSSDHYNRLNSAYSTAWNTYNQAVGQLGNNLTPAERDARMQELSNTFYRDLNQAAEGFLPGRQWQRFSQLGWQYRGFGAILDPHVVTQLNLTVQQRQQIQNLDQQYNSQLNQFRSSNGATGANAGEQFGKVRKNYDNQLNSILTPEQRQQWQIMLGEQYNFQGGAGSSSGGTGNLSGGTARPGGGGPSR